MVKGFYPTTIDEALTVLLQEEDSLIICGGSDLMVTKKTASSLVFINQIKELAQVNLHQGVLSLGACCVYKKLIHHELVPEVLKKAMREIASPAIRNIGTIGGNICNASPAGDTLPVLYALDAIIVKEGINSQGQKCITRLPISDFILGIRTIALAKNEMVTAIEIPTNTYKYMSEVTYQKVGGRAASSIAKLSFIGIKRIENHILVDIRIAFGSIGITTLRDKEIEKTLIGLSEQVLPQKKDQILALYAKQINPISDQRSTAKYRKKACLYLLENFLVSK